MSDLGVELLDLQFVGRLAIPTSARVERANRLILKLFLPGINLVHMHLVALRQIRHR
ncbi:hypothetical protein ABIA00_000358 [Bradyrhizobium ottawaense]|uniref:hypothetical protein n=1 Tax=Bradyrhizobium ottawaense TaxID=931866 RepID=UPI003833B24D